MGFLTKFFNKTAKKQTSGQGLFNFFRYAVVNELHDKKPDLNTTSDKTIINAVVEMLTLTNRDLTTKQRYALIFASKIACNMMVVDPYFKDLLIQLKPVLDKKTINSEEASLIKQFNYIFAVADIDFESE